MTAFTALWRLRIPIAIIAAAALLWWALDRYVDDAVQDDRQASAIAAQKADARADDAAGIAAASKASTIAQENEDARSVAAGSDDPLADGLRSLRTGKARDREASR